MTETIKNLYDYLYDLIFNRALQDSEILNRIKKQILTTAQNSSQELKNLIDIFNNEDDEYLQLILAECLIQLRCGDVAIPVLQKILETNDDFDDLLQAAVLLAMVNNKLGMEKLYELGVKQAHKDIPKGLNIYNELEWVIKDKTNPHIKNVLKKLAHKYNDAHTFYEYFYQEKINSPKVDA